MKDRLAEVRERRPSIDHVLRMQEHYGQVKASQQAGAVTYFAFLSFFPILALAVFFVGLLSHVYPDADQNLRSAIDSVLPGIIGTEDNQVKLSDLRSFSGLAGVLGLLGVLYAGLGWVQALRIGLAVVFENPEAEQLSFVKGKVRDLVALVVIGLTLLVAVPVTGFVAGFSQNVLDFLDIEADLNWLVVLLAIALGLAVNVLLFFTMFWLLGEAKAPTRSLWQGALLGAVGFEILKRLSSLLFANTQGQPAFQAFGIALILVVWINYTTRVTLYSACWAWTSPEARAQRQAEPADQVQGPATPPLTAVTTPDGSVDDQGRTWVKPFAAGGAAALALVAVVRRRGDD